MITHGLFPNLFDFLATLTPGGNLYNNWHIKKTLVLWELKVKMFLLAQLEKGTITFPFSRWVTLRALFLDPSVTLHSPPVSKYSSWECLPLPAALHCLPASGHDTGEKPRADLVTRRASTLLCSLRGPAGWLQTRVVCHSPHLLIRDENKHTDYLHGRFHVCCGLFQQRQQLGWYLMHRFNVAKQAIHVQPINLKKYKKWAPADGERRTVFSMFLLLNSKCFLCQPILLPSTVSVNILTWDF